MIDDCHRSRFIGEYLMLIRNPFFSIFYLLFTVSYLVRVLSASCVILQQKFNHTEAVM
jgi:hypothetical protein